MITSHSFSFYFNLTTQPISSVEYRYGRPSFVSKVPVEFVTCKNRADILKFRRKLYNIIVMTRHATIVQLK